MLNGRFFGLSGAGFCLISALVCLGSLDSNVNGDKMGWAKQLPYGAAHRLPGRRFSLDLQAG